MDHFEYRLTYNPDTDDLAASLSFLSKVVEGQSEADKIMLEAVEAQPLVTRVTLQDLQYSSIRLFLRNVIRNTKNEDIQDRGLLAVWRQFLIEAKGPVLDYVNSHETLESYSDLQELKGRTVEIAKKADLTTVNLEGMADDRFIDYIENHSLPAERLNQRQTLTATYDGKKYEINKKFRISSDVRSEVLKGHVEHFRGVKLVLKPKHLYYEGQSMWEFHTRHGRSVTAKIMDHVWLSNFQHNRLHSSEFPFPALFLTVLADITVTSDASNTKKSRTFDIVKVLGIADSDDTSQIPFEDF